MRTSKSSTIKAKNRLESFDQYRLQNFLKVLTATLILAFAFFILSLLLGSSAVLNHFEFLAVGMAVVTCLYGLLRVYLKSHNRLPIFIMVFFYTNMILASIFITWFGVLSNYFSLAWMLAVILLAFAYPMPWQKVLFWLIPAYLGFIVFLVILKSDLQSEFTMPDFISYLVGSSIFFIFALFLGHQFYQSLKNYYQELEANKQISNFKSQIIAVLGHDLRNSMGSSYQLANFLLNRWNNFNDAQKQDDLKSLYLSLEKDYKLLESLVLWAKSRMGRMSVEISDFLPHEILTKIKTHWSDLLLQKAISLEIHDKANTIKWDPMLFEIVMRNLIHNAIKNSPPQSTISVEVERDNGGWVTVVDDQGPGFETFPALGEEERGGSGSPNFSTSGVGIKLMAELLEPSGAHLEFENKPERGARVKLVFEAPHSQTS